MPKSLYVFRNLEHTVSFLQLFGTIRIGSVDDITPTTAITTYNNFANFPQAALVMIRLSLHAILYHV